MNKLITEISPYPKNAKKHPDKQVKQIANSIKEFGFNQPLVIDKDNVIIVGHGRYDAAKHIGLKEVPVIQIDIPIKKANAYRLADNKLNESKWDMDLVIEELKELDSVELVDLTGFDRDLLIEPDEQDDVIPENVPTRAKLGDIWLLGKHRVMCGDSTKIEDVEKLMDGKKADMVFTDPPYGVDFERGKFVGRTKKASGEVYEKIKNDDLKGEKLVDFLSCVFVNLREFTPNASFYVWSAPLLEGYSTLKALKNAGLKIQSQIIWNKTPHVIGRADYHWKHEVCWYGWWEESKHGWYGGRDKKSVWDVKKGEAKMHPTMKPVELGVKAITNSTQGSNNIVLDVFLGSGSTLIEAEKTNRICYGMELDPKYVDVIVKRWEDYTSKKAELMV